MDSYYKLRQLFYYKVRQGLLQIAMIITNWDSTPPPVSSQSPDPFRGPDRELNSTRHELKSTGSSSTYWYMQKDVKV